MTADITTGWWTSGWWLQGYQARRQGRYLPPEQFSPTAPQRKAWDAGYETADHDLRKDQP